MIDTIYACFAFTESERLAAIFLIDTRLSGFPRVEQRPLKRCICSAGGINGLAQGINEIITPMLQSLSVAAASPPLAALRQLAVKPFCVANKPYVACASLVPGAAVPWDLYGLKITETQWTLESHSSPLLVKRGDLRRVRGPSWDNELTIQLHGSHLGRGNRHCFFTRFVVKARLWGKGNRRFSR
jgi:hypothetical protein